MACVQHMMLDNTFTVTTGQSQDRVCPCSVGPAQSGRGCCEQRWWIQTTEKLVWVCACHLPWVAAHANPVSELLRESKSSYSPYLIRLVPLIRGGRKGIWLLHAILQMTSEMPLLNTRSAWISGIHTWRLTHSVIHSSHNRRQSTSRTVGWL